MLPPVIDSASSAAQDMQKSIQKKDEMIANLQSACKELETQLMEKVARCAQLAAARDRYSEQFELYKSRFEAVLKRMAEDEAAKNVASSTHSADESAPKAIN